uniref:Uncharacterized protein n=1 Tax=Cacopsylla melanoneura TaxID=428564 RepID=A0A8D8WK24_9HEMI
MNWKFPTFTLTVVCWTSTMPHSLMQESTNVLSRVQLGRSPQRQTSLWKVPQVSLVVYKWWKYTKHQPLYNGQMEQLMEDQLHTTRSLLEPTGIALGSMYLTM